MTGFTATAQGDESTGTVVVSLVAPSITVTVFLPLFATYTLFVTGFTATAQDCVPVTTVAVPLVAPSITVTSLLP